MSVRACVCACVVIICHFISKTRAVRGSDYSPAIVLSEEKDTENWREKK